MTSGLVATSILRILAMNRYALALLIVLFLAGLSV